MRLAVLIAVVLLAPGAHAAPLPFPRDPGVTRSPVGVHGITREAFALTAPTSVQVRLPGVPPAARLLTAIAVPEAPPGAAPTALRFRIAFESEGSSVPLYERVLDGARDRRWVDVGIALDAVAGRTGTLRFDVTVATPSAATPTVGWWALPELVVCDGAAPSLLLVVMDALRADRLGSAGYPRPTTPHLDAFAADATRFAAAFTGGPKTIPSVPQILTGRYFYWHRPARALSELLGDGAAPSRAIVNNPYVATWLRGAQPGFDAVEAGDALDARAITSAALRYLTAAGRCPTALYVHYLDTHTPYRVPARYARRFIDPRAQTKVGLTFDDVTRAWQEQYDAVDRQRIIDLYDGTIAYTDRQVGRLLRGLAKRGRLDRTLVVITSDHGEELWDHRKFFHGQSLYDELLHVPLLVRWPDFGHGRVVPDVVRTVDVAPTVAEALRHPLPESDGRSLAPLARGGAGDAPRTAFALVSHAEPRTPERQAVRTATHKLIRDVSDGAVQIYDLVTDPKEKRNLGPAAPGAAELTTLLDGFRAGLDGTGYQLRLRGRADRAVRYVLDLATEPAVPVIAIDRLTLEAGDLVDFKQRTSAFSLLGTLTPGDEDHVRFDVLAARGVLKVALHLDGAPIPDTTLRLGAASAPAGAVVDLTDAKLDGTPSPAPERTANQVVVELWRAGAAAPAPSLDDATRTRLRELGYVE